MEGALKLVQWSYIAQLVIAATAIAALLGAIWQVLVTRANARRVRVYEYADRFNQPEIKRLSALYRIYVEKQTYADFKKLSRIEQNELLILPNIIEEIAGLYYKRLLDRDVVAELLGVYVENLWTPSKTFVSEMRGDLGARVFCDWEAMQSETPARKLKTDKKLARRRAWRRLLRGASS